MLESNILDKKGLSKLIKKGMPDDKRGMKYLLMIALVYAKLLQVETGIHGMIKQY
jgi:hypothetical protein